VIWEERGRSLARVQHRIMAGSIHLRLILPDLPRDP
jgi:hypothetical protein